MPYCSECGGPVDAEQAFCAKCGTAVSAGGSRRADPPAVVVNESRPAVSKEIPCQSSQPEIQGQVRRIIAKYNGVAPESLRETFLLNQVFSGGWNIHRDGIIERLENSLQIPMPPNVEETLKTLGELERFFAAARDFEVSTKRSAGSPQTVESDLCDDIRDDETHWEYFSPWRRIVRLNVDAGAWSSWIGTKRIRLQLCALFPEWRVSISKFWRDAGEVRIELTSPAPAFCSHQIVIDCHGQMLHPLDRDLSGELSRMGIDGKNARMVCFRIRYSYFQEPAAYAIERGVKRGFLAGLLIVGLIAAASALTGGRWLEMIPALKPLRLSESPWLANLIVGVVLCLGTVLIWGALSRFGSGWANAARRRRYMKWRDERLRVQAAVAQLDVAAAYGVPIFEYQPDGLGS